MSESAELLSPATNYAIVQLPGRAFPGVVFQGDSLFCLIQDLKSCVQDLKSGQLEDLNLGLEYMLEDLNAILTSYEMVCADKGISLPYFKQ